MRCWITWVLLSVYVAVGGYVVATASIGRQDASTIDAAPAAEVTVKRSLPANHLLRDSDLEGTDTADLVGHYLARPVARGVAVADADVLTVPVLDANDGALVAVPLPVALAETGGANAGASVLLCKGDARIAEAVVLAQLCSGEGDSAACRVLVAPPVALPPIPTTGARAAISTCALAPALGPDSIK